MKDKTVLTIGTEMLVFDTPTAAVEIVRNLAEAKQGTYAYGSVRDVDYMYADHHVSVTLSLNQTVVTKEESEQLKEKEKIEQEMPPQIENVAAPAGETLGDRDDDIPF